MNQARDIIAGSAVRQRWHDLDQLRAILMLAGIPYHVGLVYAAHATWIVASPDQSQVMTWWLQFSHTFRMPAFFLIAGLFAMLLIRRRGSGPWLAGRLRRIGIPLATSLVLISPLMVMASAASLGGVENIAPGLLAEVRQISSTWTVHLWFLIYLLLYCGLFAGLCGLVGVARMEHGAALLGEQIARRPALAWVALAATGVTTLVVATAASMAEASYLIGGIFVPADFVANGLMFLTGALLMLRPAWLEGFRRPKPAIWVLAFLAAITMAAVQSGEGNLNKALTYLLMPVVGILFSHVLLSAARRWLDRPTGFTRIMVDAAMTMYLVHVVFVLWLSVLFLAVPLPAELEILIIVLLTGGGSYLVYRLVAVSPLLTFLFNGAPLQPSPATPVLAGSGARRA